MIDEIERLHTQLSAAVGGLHPDGLSASQADRVLAVLTGITDTAFGGGLLVMARAVEGESLHHAKERLARRGGLSAGEAESLVKASRSLDGLPAVADALRAGRLSRAQARLVIDTAAEVPAAQDDLLAAATSQDLKGLRDRCVRARAAADPDPTATRARQHRERHVRTWTDRDGARHGTWSLPPDAAAEVESALDAWTDRAFRQARAAGHREPVDAYRADALLAMARASLQPSPAHPTTDADPHPAPGADPTPGRAPALPPPIPKELVITVDVATVAAALSGTTDHLDPDRPDRTCELRGIGPVTPQVAAAWLDNAFVKAILHEGRDVRIVKHFGRHVPAELATALAHLYPVCHDPGCNKCRRLETDHLTPDALDGPLSLANARPTCTTSHRHKTRTDITDINAARAQGHQKMTAAERAHHNTANRQLSYDPDPGAHARFLAAEQPTEGCPADQPARRSPAADHHTAPAHDEHGHPELAPA